MKQAELHPLGMCVHVCVCWAAAAVFIADKEEKQSCTLLFEHYY